jgi:CheY-like chemotaxis protein
MRKLPETRAEEFDGRGRSFASLLSDHLTAGTHPAGRPGEPGELWTNKAFALALGHTDDGRLVRYWRQGIHRPSNLALVEKVLFGNAEVWRQARIDLREAHERAGAKAVAEPPLSTSISVELSDRAVSDALGLQIAVSDLKRFLLDEHSRHPLIFSCPFSSRAFEYFDTIIVASFDGHALDVERLAPAASSLPTLHWAQALSQYRIASALPYRRPGRHVVIEDLEAASCQVERLVQALSRYSETYRSAALGSLDVKRLLVLLEEVSASVLTADTGSSVSLLELIISRAHKLLLEHIPEPKELNQVSPDFGRDARDQATAVSSETRKVILVMEDEGMIRDMLVEYLGELGRSVIILEAASLAEAFTCMVNCQIDLLFADINMNGRMGSEVIRAMHRASPETKIVVCSGYPERMIAGSSLSACDAYLSKPTSSAEVVACARRVLGLPE